MFISSLLCFSPRGDSQIKIMLLGQNFEKNQSPKRYSRCCFVGVGCYFFIPTRHQFSSNSFNDNDFFQLNTLQDTTSSQNFFFKYNVVQSVKLFFSLSLYQSKEITNNYFILFVIKKLQKLCRGEETSNIQSYTCYISREGV